MDNNEISRLPNLYYIINDDLSFIEFDLICLVKKNEKLVLNKGIFDRVSNINNLKLLDNIENINELSLIFFEIKNAQRTPGKIIEKLIEKVNFLYPLFEKYLFDKYNIQINDYKLYFAYIFDSKFNAYQFGMPNIGDMKTKVNLNNIKNNKNDIKIIYIHAETNIGQYNALGLKNEIINLNKKIEEQAKNYQVQMEQQAEFQKQLNLQMEEQAKRFQEMMDAIQKQIQEEKKNKEELNKNFEELKRKYQEQIEITNQMKKKNKIFENKNKNNTKINKIVQAFVNYNEGNNDINSPTSLRRTKSLDSRKSK